MTCRIPGPPLLKCATASSMNPSQLPEAHRLHDSRVFRAIQPISIKPRKREDEMAVVTVCSKPLSGIDSRQQGSLRFHNRGIVLLPPIHVHSLAEGLNSQRSLSQPNPPTVQDL